MDFGVYTETLKQSKPELLSIKKAHVNQIHGILPATCLHERILQHRWLRQTASWRSLVCFKSLRMMVVCTTCPGLPPLCMVDEGCTASCTEEQKKATLALYSIKECSLSKNWAGNKGLKGLSWYVNHCKGKRWKGGRKPFLSNRRGSQPFPFLSLADLICGATTTSGLTILKVTHYNIRTTVRVQRLYQHRLPIWVMTGVPAGMESWITEAWKEN